MPTKFSPAEWIDKETMKCNTPTGWSGGEWVKVDLTLNGIDYTDVAYDFYFYTLQQSFPKSGPADATNQYIRVKGKGFRQHFLIVCSLNDTEVAPISKTSNLIKCPMVLPNWPTERYDTVPFKISIDGVEHNFGNFHYYKQIEIESVTPLIGPNEGMANVFISGKYFRSDFENAKLACRIGNTLAMATLVDSETIKCTLNKKIPLVDEG